MPGAAVHIAVADRIYTILGQERIGNLPLFFSGSIAPDAIHAKADYVREDKRRTHLTVDMPIDSFHNPAKLKIFHERINAFIRDYYLVAGADRDLHLGYVIHLLTDELFNIMIRTPFNALVFNERVSEGEREIFNRVLSQADQFDKLILSSYHFNHDPATVLEAVWDYEIRDLIGKDEINRSKRRTIDKHFKGPPPPVELTYYSAGDALNFAEYAVNDVLERLSGRANIMKIF